MIASKRLRSALSLIEILIAITLFGVGLIVMSATLTLAVRDTGAGNDLTTSQLAAHVIADRVLRETEGLGLRPTDGAIRWLGPDSEQLCGQPVCGQSVCGQPACGQPVPRPAANPWLVDAPAWGTAVPYPADARYAGQIFFRSRGRSAPYDWDFFIVIQVQREGRFAAPTGGAAGVSGMACDHDGRWSRCNAGSPACNTAFAVPGAVAVYHFGMCF